MRASPFAPSGTPIEAYLGLEWVDLGLESAHVRFNHAPHIRAGVDCASCHGDLTKQTTAERKIDLNMGFCLNCHTQKKVSIDCETCHY